MSDFKARIGRELPKENETRVVFSIRTSLGNRLEIDGTFDECVVLKLWTELHQNQAKRADPLHKSPRTVTDQQRMHWLCTQAVNVRKPLLYGTEDMFWASPIEDDSGFTPSDLRAKIDAAMTGDK
ncbi:hypothetical protein [Burkholderia anthina]|uniref:hypothetical protein n=1 Tax=Burkholderia anthina TaxID=179879 RepID=UPI001588DE9D|nr:hypothetical protein [Burkholderia anthina]